MTATAAQLSNALDSFDDDRASAWLGWRAGYAAGYWDGYGDGSAAVEDADAAAWAVMAATIRHVAASPSHDELVRRRAEPRWVAPEFERCARARERLSEDQWMAGVRRSWDLPAPAREVAA